MSSESFIPLSVDPAATCDDCGAIGAFRFATATLCTDCYQERGACCAERIDRAPVAGGPTPRCETEA